MCTAPGYAAPRAVINANTAPKRRRRTRGNRCRWSRRASRPCSRQPPSPVAPATAVWSGTVVAHDRLAPATARREPRSRPASGGRLVPGDVAFAGDRGARRVPRPAGGGHGDLLPAAPGRGVALAHRTFRRAVALAPRRPTGPA